MNSRVTYLWLIVLLAGVFAADEAFAQAHPERKHIRAGNRDYEALDYGAAEGDYRSALQKNPLSYEAALNLGDALYKQERYEEAEELLQQVGQNPFLTPEQRAKLHYNLGNTQFQQRKLQEAEESYINSLLNNPSDLESKYNLAYVQKLLEENEDEDNEGGDDNQDNQDDQDGDGDSDGDGQQDPGDGDNEQDDQGGDNSDDPSEPDRGDETPQESNISMEDAEKMLDAIQGQEDKTREKMDEQKKIQVAPSGKNW